MKKFFLTLAITSFCIIFSTGVSSAQTDYLGTDLSYKEISSKLNKIEEMTKAKNVDINALVSEVAYLNETAIKIDIARGSIDDEIKLIEKRIEALGVVDENLPEAKVIAQKRKEFNLELSEEKTRISEIDILQTKIEELNKRIFDIRNEELWGNLLKSETPIFIPKTFLTVNHELIAFGIDIIKSPFLWYSSLTFSQRQEAKINLITVFLIISFIAVLGYFLRRFIIRNWGYVSDIESPRLVRKIIAALAVWCGYGIIPTAIIGFCLYWIVSIGVVSGSFFGSILVQALHYLLYIIMGRASFRVVFTPYNEKWRLINMSTDKAKRITRAIYFTIVVVGVCSYLQHLVTINDYPLELLSYILAISASLKALCVAWIIHIYVAGEQNDMFEEDLSAVSDEVLEEKEGKTFKIGMLVSLFTTTIIVLSLFGYSRLASFVVNHSILTAILIVAFNIFRRFLYDLIQHVLLMGVWIKTFRMRRIFLRKIDFWFGIIVEPLLLLLLIGGILVLWGVPFDVLKANVYKAVSGFTVGGIKISLISIIWGVIIFALCIWFIKMLRHRIEFKMLEKTNIDAGTKHSLASGVAYVGYVMAVILAFAVMGGNLTNIALIAGALSVGIGLGLQDVVNNFVSGIIMLIERPIKVGDWVMINNEEGEVKQINIRSTEIMTFNRASVIIPNAQVLSNSVTNLTHQNNWARYTVKVNVAYGSDVDQVEKILLECASSNSKVAKKPAPYVLFQNFGDNGLEFEVRFYVNNIWDGWTSPSEVRFAINRRFREEGIEIPFPQMVIHQGAQVADKTGSQFYAKKKGNKKNVG